MMTKLLLAALMLLAAPALGASPTATLSVQVAPAVTPPPPPPAFEPPGCQPGNHGLVRGRPRIANINGAPVLVTDDGCLVISYAAFANGSGYGPGGVFENPSPYSYSGADGPTQGVNLQWVQEIHNAGFNTIEFIIEVTSPSQPESTCILGPYPFSQTIDQYVSSAQTLLSYANQVGVYLVLNPIQCGEWITPGANFDQTIQTQYMTTLAQTFGGNTNVMFRDMHEPEGYQNFSCDLQINTTNSSYLAVRNNGGPNTMFLAFSDFSFGPDNQPDANSCGGWGNLISGASSVDWSNAAAAWSSIHTYDAIAIVGMIQRLAALGVAAFSMEGPERITDCAFGSPHDTGQLTAYRQALMSNNTGWQCDDGWPNGYGPVFAFWPTD